MGVTLKKPEKDREDPMNCSAIIKEGKVDCEVYTGISYKKLQFSQI